ncbi:MAG: hypothetical protein GX633_07910 [Clostridiales bacterium]|nr:hypothetical protein [Clostridiales bacterium]
MKYLRAIIIALFIALTLSGCDMKEDIAELVEESRQANEARKRAEEAKEAELLPVTYIREIDSVFALCYDTADGLNPVKARGVYNKLITSLTHEGLFHLTDTCFPVCDLCESYTYDGESYVFTLREDCFNRTGKRVTSSDVIYSLNLQLESIPSVGELTAEGIYAVKATLLYPDGSLPARLICPIIPEDSGEQEYPDGTGDYRIAEGEKIYLACMEDYELDRIELTAVESLEDTIYSFGSKDTDLAVSLPAATSAVHYRGLYDTKSCATRRLNCVIYNVRKLGVEERICLSQGVDKSVAEVYGEAAEYSDCVFPRYTYAYSIPPEIQKAEWKDKNVTILVSEENSMRIAAAERIAENLENIGIAASVEKVKWETFENRIETGDYEMAVAAWQLPEDLSPGKLIEYTGYTDLETELESFIAAPLHDKKSASLVLNKKITSECIITPICHETVKYHTHPGDLTEVSFGNEDSLAHIGTWKRAEQIN